MTFSSHGPVLHIGSIPEREQVALYVTYEGEIHPLAYFPNEEKARLASRLLKIGWGGYVHSDDLEGMAVAVEDFVMEQEMDPDFDEGESDVAKIA